MLPFSPHLAIFLLFAICARSGGASQVRGHPPETASPRQCNSSCERRFMACAANNTYSTCRTKLENSSASFAAAGCKSHCVDTPRMERRKRFIGTIEQLESMDHHRSHHSLKWRHLKSAISQRPTRPTYCNRQNAGRCECAQHQKAKKKFEGVSTFTWWVDGEQRCMTRFLPRGHKGPLPVVVNVQCHAQDSLKGLGFATQGMELLDAANRFGFIAIGASTPKLGTWRFGNDSVVSDADPQPCSTHENRDLAYMKDILSHIEHDKQTYDANHVYTKGCSQNAQFATYSAYCFPNQIAGVWQCSAGLVVKGARPQSPRLETECASSAYERHREKCISKDPCPSCQYFPIYPCYNKRPLIHCISLYTDDAMSVMEPNNQNSSKTLGDNMFKAAHREGHDVRLLKFRPHGNSRNRSGHAPPMNQFDWLVGCLGLTEPCSHKCGMELQRCVEDSTHPHDDAYRRCMTHDLVVKGHCAQGCAPTVNMLKLSEAPTISLSHQRWGGINGVAEPHHRPNTSFCEHKHNSNPSTRFNGDKIGIEAYRALQRERRLISAAKTQSGRYLTRIRGQSEVLRFGGRDAMIPRSQLLDGRRQLEFEKLHSSASHETKK